MASVLPLLVMSLHCLLLLLSFPLIATYSSQNFTHSLCHGHERSALLQFKESLVINPSASQDPFAYPKVASWKLGGESSNCCSWDGVKCDEKTGHVIGLSLESSYLYGSINSTSSLFRLRHLRRLDLADNHFNYSKIPSAIGNLSQLAHLNLSSSGFCGQVPSEILWLYKLVSLDLKDNSLKLHNPGLRSVAEKLTNLYELHLSGVDISSQVPHSLANLSSLSSLLLKNCRLKGEFPTGIFHLPNLRFLRVGYNRDLTGYLPELWGGNHLEFLGIGETSFSGQIPDSIGNLSSLTTFLAFECNLQRSLPPSLGNLRNLISLILSDNNLRGNIPPSFGNLTHLSVLSLQRNSLQGPIPNSILGLPNLELLDLADNSLVGNVELDLAFKSRKLHGFLLSDNYLFVNTHINANTTPPNLTSLGLGSCNLKEFPSFLHNQNKLEILLLSSNRIEGLIPKWMSSVATRTLKVLLLSVNLLKGFEQPISILPWTNLAILDISNNMLQGALPIPQPSIIEYAVSNNRFTGEISPMICNLTSLLALDLSNNNLTGSLPHCLANFSESLTILQLQNNSLHGNISQTYKSGCKLRAVNLGQNGFTGKVSRSLTNCTELEVLVLGGNHLNDTFPSWLGVLSKLKVLVLGSNSFHGAIVKSKAKLDFPSLQIIDLSNNAFTGEFPFEYYESWTSMRSMDKDHLEYMHTSSSFSVTIENEESASRNLSATYFAAFMYLMVIGDTYNYSMVITNKGQKTNYRKIPEAFTAVDLSSNRLEGGIPEIFGTLKELHLLNLSNNNLTGHIPSSLGHMQQLEALDLSGNHFSGEIPVQLTQLTFLEILNVSGNNLTGPIPTGKQFDTFERSSFEGNPGLCGRPLPKRCRNDAGAPPPAPSNIDEEEGTGSAFNFGWKIVAVGYACGMVIGGVIGYVFATKKQEWLMKTFRIKQQRKRRRVAIRGHNNRT